MFSPRNAGAVFASGICAVLSMPASGDFLADSKATLTLRNFYMDRDYKGDATRFQSQSRQAEWAQGFILNVQSGYTEGPVGFAVGLTSKTGVKLDSSPDRVGTGLLAYGPDGKAESSYSQFDFVLKARAAQTELAVGGLTPMVPILVSPTVRLFPPVFRGAQMKSGEFRDLTLHAGYFDRIEERNSTNFEALRIASPWGRFESSAEGSHFAFVGADYRWTPGLVTNHYFGYLDDVYKQHYLGVQFSHALGPGKLQHDFRYFSSSEQGEARAGDIDNRYAGFFSTYKYKGHAFGAGYYRIFGEHGFVGINATFTHTHSQGLLDGEMGNPDERVWQVRYDYDFAASGLPGLLATFRYADGSHINMPAFSASRAHESERYLELSYVIQSGPLKDMAFRVRQADYQSSYSRDVNELRINMDYTIAIW
ncbi:OprD family outer membrane porin [Azotobacter vinelandii DJ]|nr:outer membrane porin, OprD family [Azotobacter vinelandii]